MSGAVVVQTAYLGDVILTTPLIAALAERHGPVSVVVTPAARPLVELDPAVARVIDFDKRRSMKGPRGVARVAASLRQRGFDHAYLPHRSLRSALTIRLAGIPHRIGFDDSPARWHYTRAMTPRGDHEADRILSLAESPGSSNLRLFLAQEDRDRAAILLRSGGVDPEQPFIVLAPGSVWATKRWPYFTELAAQLARQHAVAIVGTPRDSPDRIPRAAFPVADLTGQTSLREAAAVIQLAAAAVTNDSAPLHMAEALGTPVRAVFGPTIPELGFGPRSEASSVVQLELECRPCSLHGSLRCPLTTHECMRQLSPDMVNESLQQLLSGMPR